VKASDDAYQAGRLLALALDHTARPGGREPDYERLLNRWRTDTAFNELVGSVAAGLGLYVLGAGAQGLVVSGDYDGPFAVDLDAVAAVRASSKATDRLLAGLVLIATAAYAYPAGGDLTETSTAVVRPRELAAFITRAAEQVATLRDSEDDMDRGAAMAAQAWLELPPVLPGQRGGLRRECQLWQTRNLLEWLAKQGRARTVAAIADNEPAYQLTDRFRLGVVEVVDRVAFSILAGTSHEDAAGHVTTDATAGTDEHSGNGHPTERPGSEGDG
jgi:hypothetical protein